MLIKKGKKYNFLLILIISAFFFFLLFIFVSKNPFSFTGFVTQGDTFGSNPIAEYTMFARNPTHTNYYPSSVNLDNFKQIWNITTSFDFENWKSPPLIYDGKIYSTGRNNIKVYNLSTKDLVWEKSLGQILSSTPVISNNVIYITTDCCSNKVYALDALNGNILWEYNSGESQFVEYSSPVVYGGLVYLKTYTTGKILALNATNGNLIWNFTKGSSYGSATPAVYNGVLYISFDKMYALNAKNGSQLWEYSFESPPSLVEIYVSPTVINGVVYIGRSGSSGNIYALNATNGNLLWKSRPDDTLLYSLSSPLAFSNGKLYFGTSSNSFKLYSMNATNGNVIWGYSFAGAIPYYPLITADEKLFVNVGDKFYIFNATNGDPLANYSGGVVSIAGGVIYSQTTDYIYAYSSVPDCTSNWIPINISCQINDEKTQYYYDSNNCGVDTEKPNNITYVCDFCTPNWELLNNGVCYEGDYKIGFYNDSNNCYKQTNLSSDLENKPENITYSCDYDKNSSAIIESPKDISGSNSPSSGSGGSSSNGEVSPTTPSIAQIIESDTNQTNKATINETEIAKGGAPITGGVITLLKGNGGYFIVGIIIIGVLIFLIVKFKRKIKN